MPKEMIADPNRIPAMTNNIKPGDYGDLMAAYLDLMTARQSGLPANEDTFFADLVPLLIQRYGLPANDETAGHVTALVGVLRSQLKTLAQP